MEEKKFPPNNQDQPNVSTNTDSDFVDRAMNTINGPKNKSIITVTVMNISLKLSAYWIFKPSDVSDTHTDPCPIGTRIFQPKANRNMPARKLTQLFVRSISFGASRSIATASLLTARVAHLRYCIILLRPALGSGGSGSSRTRWPTPPATPGNHTEQCVRSRPATA